MARESWNQVKRWLRARSSKALNDIDRRTVGRSDGLTGRLEWIAGHNEERWWVLDPLTRNSKKENRKDDSDFSLEKKKMLPSRMSRFLARLKSTTRNLNTNFKVIIPIYFSSLLFFFRRLIILASSFVAPLDLPRSSTRSGIEINLNF